MAFPVAPAVPVAVRRAQLVRAVLFDNFSKALARCRCAFLGVHRYLSRPQESAVGMLCKTACLRKQKLLWYPHSGLGKYFKRIAINSVFGSNRALAAVKL